MAKFSDLDFHRKFAIVHLMISLELALEWLAELLDEPIEEPDYEIREKALQQLRSQSPELINKGMEHLDSFDCDGTTEAFITHRRGDS